MADQNPQKKSQSLRQELHSIPPSKPTIKNKSFTSMLCKCVIFLLFIVAIPLFPSEAPSFINQTVLTKFWDVVHLLFIGLAVSYGLFSSRNVEDVNFDDSNTNNSDDPQSSYVSRIFHVSPIFENEYEKLSGFDEKNVYYGGETMVNDVNGMPVVSEQGRMESFDSENGFDMPFENDENSVVQAWNSQYFQGESMVVMSEANYAIDEFGKPGQAVAYRPLGLPVRSLNSRITNLDGSQFSTGSESGSSLNGGSSNSSGRSVYEKNFGDMGPVNLEDRFDETVANALASQVPWHSRSGRMEMREKEGFVASYPSHFRPLSVDETQFESLKLREQADSVASRSLRFRPLSVDETQFESLKLREQADSVACRSSRFRPLSVDETQFESLKSQSFRSTASFSSQASSTSYSPSRLSPSNSDSSELPTSEMEELEEKKTFRASYPPVSKSPSAIMNGERRLNAFHLRRYSSGSLFQKDSRGSLKQKLKDSGGNRKDYSLGCKERDREQNSLKSDNKPATTVKGSSRGKSVRTIRAGGYAAETMKNEETSKNYIDDKLRKTWGNSEAASTEKNEMKRGLLDNMSIGLNEKSLDIESHIRNPTSAKYQKRAKEEYFEGVNTESKVDSKGKTGSFHVSSDKDAVIDTSNEPGHDPYEVDRKAGEFIAKFREQIRLQKVASIERSRGMRISGN